MKNKKKLNILVVDDEVKSGQYLKEIVQDSLEHSEHFELNYVEVLNNPFDVIGYVSKNTVHIMFLDINMPGRNGMDVAKEINQFKKETNNKFPLICFTTAYDNYALEAFKQDAYDYILKPIIDDNIIHFFEKASSNFNFEEENKFILAPVNGTSMKIHIADIYYLKSDGKYVSIKTLHKNILVQESLYNIENQFSEFVKVHRSYLVNKSYIEKIFKRENQLYLKMKNIHEEVPISRRQKSEIEGKLDFIID